MSPSADEQETSAPLRRSARDITLSRKAEAIVDTGGSLPGHPLLAEQIPFTTTMSKAQMAAQSKINKASRAASKARDLHSNADRYGLGPDSFTIYQWTLPRPQDFLRLSEAHQRWKTEVDTAQKRCDIDDGADDWHDFDNQLPNRGIASCFMKRAKRAFWAGKSWGEFEDQERHIDSSMPSAGQKVDPCALDNDRRMEIFEALKQRLCEEIWLKPYVSPATRKDSTLPGIAETKPNSQASIALNPLIGATPGKLDHGIVVWSRNREGAPEPWYGGEVANPSGIENMKQYYRSRIDRRAGQTRASQSSGEAGLQMAQALDVGMRGLPVSSNDVEDILARQPDVNRSSEGDI